MSDPSIIPEEVVPTVDPVVDPAARVEAVVDAAARSVPGVEELYFARSLPQRLWRLGGAVAAATTTYSLVERRGETWEATVSIGIAGGRVGDIAERVAASVREALRTPDAQVTVRVSRITSA